MAFDDLYTHIILYACIVHIYCIYIYTYIYYNIYIYWYVYIYSIYIDIYIYIYIQGCLYLWYRWLVYVPYILTSHIHLDIYGYLLLWPERIILSHLNRGCQALGLDGKRSRCAESDISVKRLVGFDWNCWFIWPNVFFWPKQVFVIRFRFFCLKERWRGGRGPAPISFVLQHPSHTNLYSWRSETMRNKTLLQFCPKVEVCSEGGSSFATRGSEEGAKSTMSRGSWGRQLETATLFLSVQ